MRIAVVLFAAHEQLLGRVNCHEIGLQLDAML
jgi:hypothetical protein